MHDELIVEKGAPKDKPGPDGDSDEENEKASPKAGQQSASDMVAAGISGVQFSFDVTSSTSSTKDHTLDQKERHLIENGSHGYVESKLTDDHSTSSDFSLTIQAGTNDNETNPSMQQLYQDQIAMQDNIPSDLSDEATDAGIDASELADIDRIRTCLIESTQSLFFFIRTIPSQSLGAVRSCWVICIARKS